MTKPNLYILPDSIETGKSKEKKRRRGERKDGLVAVYGDYGRKSDGTRNRKTFYGHTMDEATKKKKAYDKKLGLGVTPEDMNITVAEWCDRWLKVYKTDLKGANKASYEAIIKKIKKKIGEMKISSVTEVLLQDILNDESGKSDSQISKVRFILKGIFHRAFKNHLIDDNPASDLTRPQGTTGTHRALEPEEIQVVSNNYIHHRFGLAIMIMLYAGLRRGEAVALRWKHVDLEHRCLSVVESAEMQKNKPRIKKGAKTEAGERIIPLCEPLYIALMNTPEPMRKEYVCTSSKGKLLTLSAFERAWESFIKCMGLAYNGYAPKWDDLLPGQRREIKEKKEKGEWQEFAIRTHDLRHTFATGLYDAGVDIKSAQYYLGHSDIKTTMDLYTHLSAERKKKSRASMTTFLDNWTQQVNNIEAKKDEQQFILIE